MVFDWLGPTQQGGPGQAGGWRYSRRGKEREGDDRAIPSAYTAPQDEVASSLDATWSSTLRRMRSRALRSARSRRADDGRTCR